MILDHYWLLFAIPGLLIGLYAQARLSSAYGRYARVGVASGLSGADAARERRECAPAVCSRCGRSATREERELSERQPVGSDA